MAELLYLVGAPASGKTTLLNALTEGLTSTTAELSGVPVTVWGETVVELGRRREDFGGTDSLAMSIQPKAVQLLKDGPALLLGEGDRLANAGFFNAAIEAGYRLRLFHLDTPRQLLEDRRALREIFGQGQSRIWLKGRETKVARLAEAWDMVRIPGELRLSDQLAILRGRGGWVVEALRAEVRQ